MRSWFLTLLGAVYALSATAATCVGIASLFLSNGWGFLGSLAVPLGSIWAIGVLGRIRRHGMTASEIEREEVEAANLQAKAILRCMDIDD